MGSVCTDHHHHHKMQQQQQQYLAFSSPKKSHHNHHHLQDLNIPPRKLLSRRSPPHSPSTPTASDLFSDHHFPLSPSSSKHTPDSSTSLLMRKFLPFNRASADLPTDESDGCSGNSCYDPDSDPYSSDDFRMYEFKVRRCTRSRSHDWTDCPFAHPGEKARRRDPRRHHYSSEVCPEYRRSGGHCTRGDECEFAHGVFEVWLHPARYRTEACKDGKGCKRKVCFFAHSPRELRVLPAAAASIRDGDGGDVDGCGGGGQYGGNLVSLGDLLMKSGGGGGGGNCCRYSYSPRSTLQQVGGGGGGGSYCMNCCGGVGNVTSSPPMSPPSPTTNPGHRFRGGGSSSFSPLRTGSDRFACMDQMMGDEQESNYLREMKKEIALGQLMEAMSFNEPVEERLMMSRGNSIVNESNTNNKVNGLWVDVYSPSSPPEEYGGDDRFLQSHSSSPYGIRNLFSPAAAAVGDGGGGDSFVNSPTSNGSYKEMMMMMMMGGVDGLKVANSRFSNEVVSTTTGGAATAGGGVGDPDLGWVDDLLM